MPKLSISHRRILAHSRLLPYIDLQWPGYEANIHHVAIANALEAVEAGGINRLMIFMPPRAGKTMLVSEFFPAWYMGRNPTDQIIATTYSFDRAGDTGRKVRNQLVDPEFSQIFKNCTVSSDTKSSNKVGTKEGGVYYSVGIGGAIVGRGANLFLIDDPIKSREDAESKNAKRKMIDWFQSVAYTRLMTKNAIILIMTRWAFDDLAGFLLKENAHENWHVLNLPAIAETDNDVIGRMKGDALWPSKYPKKRLMQIKETIGSREWNAQYQQRPLPKEGGIFNLDDFQRFDLNAPPAFKHLVISADTAFKETELHDPSAFGIWGMTDNDFYLIYVYANQMGYPKLRKKAISLWEKYNKQIQGPVRMLIEDRASGQSLIQDLKVSTSIPVIAIKADANKEIRADESSNLVEAGRVYLPERAPWLIDFETEVAQFPYGFHDDQVDQMSQFLRWAGKKRFRRSGKKFWK